MIGKVVNYLASVLPQPPHYKISVNWCEYTVLQCRDAETLELELRNKHGTLTKLRMSIIKQIDKNVYTKMLLIFSSIECQHPF